MSDESVLATQIGKRPQHIATCPRCLKRDAEILHKPITRCPECSGEPLPKHDPSRHPIKVSWYLCGRCDLTFSGTQEEYDREQLRAREAEQIAEPQFAAAMAQLGPSTESQETT